MVNGLTIGSAAKLAGLSVPTVRFYESQGLITQPTRGDRGRRYDDATVKTLLYIGFAKRAGLGLKELREIRHQREADEDFCASIQEKLELKVLELGERADEMAQLRTRIRVFLAKCPLSSSR